MNPRTVNPVHGGLWIYAGFQMFRRSAMAWISYTLILAAMWFGSMLIPLIGPLVFNLLSVVLFAGVLLACRAQERHEALTSQHLFSGFRSNVPALITVGGVYLLGAIIIISIMFQFIDPQVLASVKEGKKPDAETAILIMRSMGSSVLVAMLLYMPLMMAVWFAPALIVFDNCDAKQSMQLSFMACLVNILPFTLYGVALMVLWVIALIPLGAGLIVLMPVIFCSVYVAYHDIFHAPGVKRDEEQASS